MLFLLRHIFILIRNLRESNILFPHFLQSLMHHGSKQFPLFPPISKLTCWRFFLARLTLAAIFDQQHRSGPGDQREQRGARVRLASRVLPCRLHLRLLRVWYVSHVLPIKSNGIVLLDYLDFLEDYSAFNLIHLMVLGALNGKQENSAVVGIPLTSEIPGYGTTAGKRVWVLSFCGAWDWIWIWSWSWIHN